MAISRSDKYKAGLFLVITCGLFLVMLIMLIGTSWLRVQDTYYIEFHESVRGLKPGSPVRYYGEEVGKVRGIFFDSQAHVARISVEVDPKTVIRQDCVASLEIDSLIIGNRFIEITPGDVTSPRIPPNNPQYLLRSQPSNLARFQANIQHLTGEMPQVIDNINRVFSPQNALMLSSILFQVNTFMETNTAAFTETLDEFRVTLAMMNEALDSANKMILQNQRAIAHTIHNLQQTTYTLNELLEKINRQPAILLHGTPHKESRWDED